MVKTIYLLRHAKSSWGNAELEDHDRPLSKRGRRSAGAVAAYLKRSQIAPYLVVCSSAERARQTLDLVSPAIKPSKVILDRNVYEAGPRKLMKYLCQLPETAETVFLIGQKTAACRGQIPHRRPRDVRVRWSMERLGTSSRARHLVRHSRGSPGMTREGADT